MNVYEQIADQLMELPDRTRYQIVAPVVSQKKGEFVDLFKELAAKGYARAIVDGDTWRTSPLSGSMAVAIRPLLASICIACWMLSRLRTSPM